MLPSIELFKAHIIEHDPPRIGFTELVVAETQNYVGKLLTYEAGFIGPLQYHLVRDETSFIYDGTGIFEYWDADNKLCSVAVSKGISVHIPPGAVHRFIAKTQCLVFEASAPPMPGDRVNVEHE